MANRHIKVINGRRYYYESIRKGKKVTSKYLGPVDERKRKARKVEEVQQEQTQEIQETPQPQPQAEKPSQQQEQQEDTQYIG